MFRKKITFIVSLSLISFISHAAEQGKPTPSSTSSTPSDDSACGLRGTSLELFLAAQFLEEDVWQQNRTTIEGKEHSWSSSKVTSDHVLLAFNCAVKRQNSDAAYRLALMRYKIEHPILFQLPKTNQQIGHTTAAFVSGFATGAIVFGGKDFFGGKGGSDS